MALYALYEYTLPDGLLNHTLYALPRIAERRKQYCALVGAFSAYLISRAYVCDVGAGDVRPRRRL